MEQFNLDTWLQDKSRKVVTRDGRAVRILCTDAKAKDGCCIIAAIETDGEEEGYQFFKDGTAYSSKSSIEDCADLFFADEEEGLTEFDKCLLSAFYSVAGKAVTTIGPASFQEDVNEWSKTLLDLAIKEEILKDLPKWKRVPKTWKVEDNAKVVFSEDYKYYIDKKELFKKLQKE